MIYRKLISAAVKSAQKKFKPELNKIAAHPSHDLASALVRFEGGYTILDCVTEEIVVPTHELFDPNEAKMIALANRGKNN